MFRQVMGTHRQRPHLLSNGYSEASPQTDELAKNNLQRIRSVGFFYPLEKLALFVHPVG
jgi:hypothetical protein